MQICKDLPEIKGMNWSNNITINFLWLCVSLVLSCYIECKKKDHILWDTHVPHGHCVDGKQMENYIVQHVKVHGNENT